MIIRHGNEYTFIENTGARTGMDDETTSVMLVDDHPIIRHSMTNLLEMEPDLKVCCQAEGAAPAVKAFNECHPDLAIIDLNLKEGSGLELIKTIHSMDPNVRILVLSHYDEDLYAERSLSAGAQGFVNKQEAPGEIIKAIRTVMAGGIYVSDAIKDRMFERGTEASSNGGIETLSDREMEVFEMIGQGVSTKGISDSLYISVKTVETHRDHIRTKLGLKSGRDVAVFAIRWAVENS
jgi:DNA-binding NarL/FixJ family response regulator